MKRVRRMIEKPSEKLFRIIFAIEETARNVAAEHTGEDWHGIQPCPVCGGNLALIHSAEKGRVWGFCGTARCLRWME